MAKKDVRITVSAVDKATKEFNKIAAAVDGAKAKIESMGGSLKSIAAGAGLAGMAGYAIKAAKDWGKAVDDIVDQTGAAGEEASKLLAIAQRNGIGTDEAAGMMAKFGKATSKAFDELAKANEKGEQSDDIFSRLGITLEETDKTNLYTTFQKVAEKMRDMADGADKDRVAMELFGRAGYQMHDMLNMSQQEMQKVIDKAQQMGLIISGETAQRWEQFDRNLQALQGTASKLAITIGNELLPRVEDLLESTQKSADYFVSMGTNNKAATSELVIMGAELGIAKIAMDNFFGLSIPLWIKLPVYIGIAIDKLNDFTLAIMRAQGHSASYYDAVRNNLAGSGLGMGLPQDIATALDDERVQESRSGWGKRPSWGIEAPKNTTLRAPTLSGGGSQSAFDKYMAQLREELQILKEKYELQKITYTEYLGGLQQALTGISSQSVGADEYNKKLLAQLGIEGQIKTEKMNNAKAIEQALQQMQDSDDALMEREIEIARKVADEQIGQQMRVVSAKAKSSEEELSMLQTLLDEYTQKMTQALSGQIEMTWQQIQALQSKVESVASAVRSTKNQIETDNVNAAKQSKEAWADMTTDIVAGFRKAGDLIRQIEYELVRDLIRRWMGLATIKGGLLNLGGSSSGSWTSGLSSDSPIKYTPIGSNASGTDYWRGGLTWVGERGPELLNLPRGSSITPANQVQSPGVKVTVINNTGTQAQATATTQYDGKDYIVNVVLEAYSTDRGGLRTVLTRRG